MRIPGDQLTTPDFRGQDKTMKEENGVPATEKVTAFCAASISQLQAKKAEDQVESYAKTSPSREKHGVNSGSPANLPGAVPPGPASAAQRPAFVSNGVLENQEQLPGCSDTQQPHESLHAETSKCYAVSPKGAASSIHSSSCAEKDGMLQNSQPLLSLERCPRKKPPDATLDATEYGLYAACYQWYYHVMRSAKEKAAKAATAKPENQGVEPFFPDSKKELVGKWLKRPARQQVDNREMHRYSYTEGGTEYNIWYGKYLTDRYSSKAYQDREVASYKCCPEQDAGYTLANTNSPSSDNYFCIYFAKGACTLGKNCHYRHMIPTLNDEGHIEWSHDIFGRERFNCHRDDMDGVGSFNSECKTLFVCGFRVDHAKPDALRHAEEFLRREFEVWGDVEDMRVIPKKQIAFVTYAYRVQAEFAKVAMADQNLGPRAPLLVVKWAHHNSRAEKKRKIVEQAGHRTHVLTQSSFAKPEDSADMFSADVHGRCSSSPDNDAADFQRLMECRRSGNGEETDVLSKILQRQSERWQRQLQTFYELREQSGKICAHGEPGSKMVCTEWATVMNDPAEKALKSLGLENRHVGQEETSPLTMLPLAAKKETLFVPAGTSHISSPDDLGERRACTASACNRIQEILSRVENVDPCAFEVQI